MAGDDLRQIFYQECEELLAAAEQNLSALAEGDDPDSLINGLFRAVHSIKGGARAFEMARLAEFAHLLESYMDLVRKHEEDLTDECRRLLFEGVDMLAALVEESRDGGIADQGQLSDLTAKLAERLKVEASVTEKALGPSSSVATASRVAARSPVLQVSVGMMPRSTLSLERSDPRNVIDQFKELGSCELAVDISRLPSLRDLDPNICYFTWQLTLVTEKGRAALLDITDMLDDIIQFSISGNDAGDVVADAAPVKPATSPIPGAAHAPPAPAKEAPTPAAKTRAPDAGVLREQPTVRVDVGKLDQLGNMVGELVITQSFVEAQVGRLDPEHYPELFRAVEVMAQHIRELQDSSLSIRAQPLKAVFSRFGRIVRDLEKSTGKRVNLVVSGDATEIDKTVVERLSDPLTHLIRNCIDHGIESPEKRIEAGKPAEGTIHLSAQQRGSQVVIELADDGAGINRKRILGKAIERGLVQHDHALSDADIDELIFHPGFSTAEVVTEVSGRGVGMDAVRQAIVSLGGRVLVASEEGVGTRFSLILPLSLAVMDAMVALVGQEKFLLPITNVVESLKPVPGQILATSTRGKVLSLRGEMLRIIDLAEIFSIPDGCHNPTDGILVVVEGAGVNRVALLVDDLIGQEPVVVKSLEKNYRKVPGISAATILGDGRAALILDLLAIGIMANDRRQELRMPRLEIARNGTSR